MNEVKISPVIPYSIAHDMFLRTISWYFKFKLKNKLKKLIETIRENWTILDSKTRNQIIAKFRLEKIFNDESDQDYYEIINNFITWAQENRENQSTTTRPLNDFVELPVVNMSKGE